MPTRFTRGAFTIVEHKSTGASLSAGHLSLLPHDVFTISNARNWRPPCGLKASSLARLPHPGMGRQSCCSWPTCPRMGENGIVILHLSYTVYYFSYILNCIIHTFVIYAVKRGSANRNQSF